MSNNIQYLCQPPKHDNYDELRDKVLSTMGTDSEKYIQDTIDFINEKHAIKVRTGRGRKSHGEHALLFYQYLLEYVQSHKDEMKQYDEKIKEMISNSSLTSQKDKTGENNATAHVENENSKGETTTTDGGKDETSSDTPKDDKMKESSTVMTIKQSEEGDNSDEKKLDNGHNNGTKINDVHGIKDEQQEKKDESDKPLSTARQIALKSPDMVWCQFCKDDPKVQLCVFCGCRNCYGKHHNDNLILCIKCDELHHTFCVDNPPTVVVGDTPKKNEWYCTDCDRIMNATDSEKNILMDSTKLVTVHTDTSGDLAVRRSKRCPKKPSMIEYEEPKKSYKKGSASNSSRGVVQQSNKKSQQTTTTEVKEKHGAAEAVEGNDNNIMMKVDETVGKEIESGITKDTKPEATKKKRGRPAKSEKRGKSPSPATTLMENAQGTDQAIKANNNNEKISQESDTIGQKNGSTPKKRKRTAAATTTNEKKNKDETTTTTTTNEDNTSKDQEEAKEEATEVNNDAKMKTTQNDDVIIDETTTAFDNSSHDMGTDIVGTVTFGPAPTTTTTTIQGMDNSNDNAFPASM